MSMQQQTATRETLTEAWRDEQSAIDWMAAPGMAEYVNGLVSNRPLNGGGHWAAYANERFVRPLADRLGRPLRMLSLGCGSGHIEHDAIAEFGWPIDELLGLEYDETLRDAASRSFSDLSVRAQFRFADFNDMPKSLGPYDLIFVCHALHHVTAMETFFPRVADYLSPHGLFIGIDYFGPNRFQVTKEARSHIERLHERLPAALRRNLRTGSMEMTYPTVEEVIAADPSEAPRSEEVRRFLDENFGTVETRPMGGTILRWLLNQRAGNYDHRNSLHRQHAEHLQAWEEALIRRGTVASDDLFFVRRALGAAEINPALW